MAQSTKPKAMSKLITSEKSVYRVTRQITNLCTQCVVFYSGWQMIVFLSDINAEAQNN